MGERGADHLEETTPGDLEGMRQVVRQAVEAGAIGFASNRADGHRSVLNTGTRDCYVSVRLCVCASVRLCACVSVCLCICASVCACVCLCVPACLCADVPACVPACLRACVPARLRVCVSVFLPFSCRSVALSLRRSVSLCILGSTCPGSDRLHHRGSVPTTATCRATQCRARLPRTMRCWRSPAPFTWLEAAWSVRELF
eukprot:SAG11_NODE_230_length_11943_cov_73.442962_7_plen_200_part_00